MINKTLKILLILISTNIYSQNQMQKDSVANEICKMIENNKNLSDSARIAEVYIKHMYPYLDKFPENQQEEIGTNIYYRLQRNCKEFVEILNRNDPAKGDWKIVNEKPKILIDKSVSQSFNNYEKFRYYEANGDIINVEIKNGFWIDNFLNKTYSKLKFNWINDFTFEIEFIESNNESRKNFSNKGDKYIYEIFNKTENYFELTVFADGNNQYLTFKLYFE
ncbi:hypothetical protein [Lutibacter maritimus]|uniref:hypothetical protein n=1 Tax=Lutibacter maritimus TaxID=593133 RepID=UPI001C43218B|nr:hypothetical protein [Lutibacter maritimus]